MSLRPITGHRPKDDEPHQGQDRQEQAQGESHTSFLVGQPERPMRLGTGQRADHRQKSVLRFDGSLWSS
ncbi:MAG: hypothetical protein JWR00_78 [Rubritepida sp.]|nr:hypothetical protein [Rubritepida sp.]